MLHAARIRAYLERLGITEIPEPTLATLRTLHVAHLRRIPFENLSIHLGEPIVLEPEALVSKLVDRQRGGFCYELNGAFAGLLESLGFDVTLLEARVHDGDRLGPPYDHLTLRVQLAEPWLVDVGFGDNFHLPLRLDDRREQVDAGGTFRIVEVGGGHLDLLRDGAPQYRFDLTAHDLADYRATCWWHQTSPESHFTRNPVCSIATPTGRVTLRGDLLIETVDGRRTERTLDRGELLDVYRERFGVDLDRLPGVTP